jgi:hypothetical protein
MTKEKQSIRMQNFSSCLMQLNRLLRSYRLMSVACQMRLYQLALVTRQITYL